MPKPKVQRTNATTAQKSNGARTAKTRPALPAVPPGYSRVPTDPLWWDGTHERELHGALVDFEVTASREGRVTNALVVIVSMDVHAFNNRGELVTVPKGESVRLDAPELQKIGAFATDPTGVLPIIVYRVDDGGRPRFAADLGNEPMPREQFKPKTPPPAAAEQPS